VAQTIQIRVEVDAKGVVTGLQQVSSSVANLGPQFTDLASVSHQGFDRMSNDYEKAHVAGLLLERDLGVHLPRAMLTLILQSQLAQQALLAAFSVTSIGLFAASVPEVLKRLQGLSDWAMGYSADLKEVEKSAKEASEQAFIHPRNVEESRAHLAQVSDEQLINSRLTNPAKQVRINEVPFVPRPHTNAGLGAKLEQTLGGQHFDGFAQYCAADLEMPAKIAFGGQGGFRAADTAAHDAQGNFPGNFVV